MAEADVGDIDTAFKKLSSWSPWLIGGMDSVIYVLDSDGLLIRAPT